MWVTLSSYFDKMLNLPCERNLLHQSIVAIASRCPEDMNQYSSDLGIVVWKRNDQCQVPLQGDYAYYTQPLHLLFHRVCTMLPYLLSVGRALLRSIQAGL
jgi:hypothetical protein